MPSGLYDHIDDQQLIEKVVHIWGNQVVAEVLEVDRGTITRWVKSGLLHNLRKFEREALILRLLPPPRLETQHAGLEHFRFIDLFAGIGGIRRSFEDVGGRCVFTSEWNDQAVRTYKANHFDDVDHVFNSDIRQITEAEGVSDRDLIDHIADQIPDHEVLLAGFPCQPFSIAGVSKKNSLGRAHGFDCKMQGTLFFDICKVLQAKRPAAFILENVKNLKSHNKGDTYRTILQALNDAGYDVPDPGVVDAAKYLPQHRERIVIVGFRRDLGIADGFSLQELEKPDHRPVLGEILDPAVPDKYTLTDKLWLYLQNYAKKHQAAGNGFGFGLVTPEQTNATRTLSARYYKDGSEILLSQGSQKNPRRLTPRECARLMGFDAPGEASFKIPVSDTQAYKQFGNSVAVPVFEAVAKLMAPRIMAGFENTDRVFHLPAATRACSPTQLRLMEKSSSYRAKVAG
ncbi:MAG TPA: DNA (cytosine-5-)-methyltransferase [Pseudomonas sabulinigri]|uniref:DNA (cytosine-5-)-methyltransferase n=1 Tax=marine sediment metagenome TaxID=412755 RepID=A0A0F9VW33_9ZZZZ|nr:DNA (cytosine-5-)-methyltransferase [Halopseudomonas sabulinigri]HEC50344.1 DNA (cytosine-5-)-methyltransferase [Halopseudomonas sabulinigri]